MATNSLEMMINQSSRALQLTDLSTKYEIRNGTQIYRKDGTALLTGSDSYALGFIPKYNSGDAGIDEIRNLIYSGDTFTIPNFVYQGYDYIYPEPRDYYVDLYAIFFKLSTASGADIYLTMSPIITKNDDDEINSITPLCYYALTNTHSVKAYTTDESPELNWRSTGLHLKGDYIEFVGGAGYLYDTNGKPYILFMTKRRAHKTDGSVSEWYQDGFITNNEYLNNCIEYYGNALGKLFKDLSFNLVDKEDFDYGNTSKPSGYSGGSFDNSSDTIVVPSSPGFNFTSQGGGKLYKVQTVSSILNEISPDFTTPSGIDALAEYVHNIFEIQNSQALKAYLVDAYAVPFTPETSASERIQLGWKELLSTGRPLTHQFVTVSCGSYSLKEYYSSFMDYDTSIKLYLPFYGFVDINAELAIGTVDITYRFDVVSGEFIAFIKSKSSKSELNSVIAQYSGTAITHLPLNTVDNSSKLNGAISGVTNLVNGGLDMVGGNIVSGGLEAAKGFNNISTLHPTASLSNSYSGSSALMGIRTPFYLISRPVSQFSAKYRSELGLPLNVAKKLSDVKGFTICQVPDYNNSNATLEECEQIKNLLNSGIIL